MEAVLELPAREQFVSSLSNLETQAKSRTTEDEPLVSTTHSSTFLKLLETIPGVGLRTDDKQAIQSGKIIFTDQGIAMDLFNDGDVHASASLIFGRKHPITRELVSVVAFRKIVGGKAAEIRLKVGEGAKFMGGSFLVGDKIPIDSGMGVEGAIDFNASGDLRHPSGNFQTHGIRKINVAKIIATLVNHESTLKPHQILSTASI